MAGKIRRFENVGDQALSVPGVGTIQPGQVVDTPEDLSANENFAERERGDDQEGHAASKGGRVHGGGTHATGTAADKEKGK